MRTAATETLSASRPRIPGVHLSVSTALHTPLLDSVRDFKLYAHKFDTLVAQDVKQDLSLRHMAEKAKSDAVIYRNLAEPVLADMSDVSSLASMSPSRWVWTLAPIGLG